MGKQITFFMTHEDENDFVQAIRHFGPVRIIYNTFDDESKMQIETLQPVGTASNDGNLSLINPAITDHVVHRYYSANACHCVNLAESEVVQFNRSKPVNTWLANGRLWFDDKSNTGSKSAAFLKWAKSLFKWIRTNYCQDSRGHFVAPRALELSKTGKLHLGPPTEPLIPLNERKRMLGLE